MPSSIYYVNEHGNKITLTEKKGIAGKSWRCSEGVFHVVHFECNKVERVLEDEITSFDLHTD